MIDPKGVPDIRKFHCLIKARNTEVLINFMFQFASRFASSTTGRMPTLDGWLSDLPEIESRWREDFISLNGQKREIAITDRAREVLRKLGGYDYAPAITVDETAAERTLYKLIYLSRHPVGLKVFRDAHVKALETQAAYKSARRSDIRRQKFGMDDLFQSVATPDSGERSAVEMASGYSFAKALLKDMLSKSPQGLLWEAIWPPVLDSCTVTYNQLGDYIRELKSDDCVKVPAWTSNRLKRPKDGFVISLP